MEMTPWMQTCLRSGFLRPNRAITFLLYNDIYFAIGFVCLASLRQRFLQDSHATDTDVGIVKLHVNPAKKAQQDAKVEKLFAMVDKSGDGKISEAELAEYLKVRI